MRPPLPIDSMRIDGTRLVTRSSVYVSGTPVLAEAALWPRREGPDGVTYGSAQGVDATPFRSGVDGFDYTPRMGNVHDTSSVTGWKSLVCALAVTTPSVSATTAPQSGE